MAGPDVAPPTGEEEFVRGRRSGSSDNTGSFSESDVRRAESSRIYRNHREALNRIRSLIEERRIHSETMDEYAKRFDDSLGGRTQVWMSPDGRSIEFSYDEFLDYMSQHTEGADRDGIIRSRESLDKHPKAIYAAERAGFSFADENDIRGSAADMDKKMNRMAFLNDVVDSYNNGDYIPYYDRDSAHQLIFDNADNEQMPFNGRFVRSSDSKLSDEAIDAMSQKYNMSPKEIRDLYEAADRVILSYERDVIIDPDSKAGSVDDLKIDVDYESLFGLSKASASMQAQINQDGVHVDGFFDKVRDSAKAYADGVEAKKGMYRSSVRIDECDKNIDEIRTDMRIGKGEYEASLKKSAGVGSGLRAMYDKEMNRYRDGYAQQPPLMFDMAKRWANEKTRALDSRIKAKEQLRNQKWAEKTGINERGIKTDGTMGDFFKSIFRECRRELYVSGVADFSLVGDTDKLLLAIGMDSTQRAFERARLRAMKIDEKITDRKINKERGPESNRYGKKKGMDSANYTRAIQIASEADTGVRFNGKEAAARDYDGRDNNPADVMAGWDDSNEHFKDTRQQERNLQNLVDDKGYHTGKDDKDKDGPDIDAPEAE